MGKMTAESMVSLTSAERAETSMLGGLQTEVYLQQSGVWRWTHSSTMAAVTEALVEVLTVQKPF